MAAIVEITEFQRYELIRLLNKLNLSFVHSKFGEAFTAFLDGSALALNEDEIANLTHLINNLNLGMSHARMGDFLMGLMDPAKAYDLVYGLKLFERDHIHHLLNTLNEDLAEVGFADLTLEAVDYVLANQAPATGNPPAKHPAVSVVSSLPTKHLNDTVDASTLFTYSDSAAGDYGFTVNANATINGNTVTFNKSGDVVITATLTADHSVTASATITIAAANPVVSGKTPPPDKNAGETISGGDLFTFTNSVVGDYSFSGDNGATVNGATITLAKSGATNITATLTSDNKVHATVQLNVGAAPVQDAITAVTVSPTTVASLTKGTTQTFTANVSVTGTPDKSVNWTVDPPANGTITDAGVFTPSKTVTTATTIKATSKADATKSGTASITKIVDPDAITAVTVSPATVASLTKGTTQTFTANVSATGTPDKSVNWTVDPPANGTITDAGVFTPSKTVTTATTIKATSKADATKSGTATITVINAAPEPAKDFKVLDGTTALVNETFAMPAADGVKNLKVSDDKDAAVAGVKADLVTAGDSTKLTLAFDTTDATKLILTPTAGQTGDVNVKISAPGFNDYALKVTLS